MLAVGVAVFLVGVFGTTGLYTWARWDFASTRRAKHIPPRYLLACGVSAVAGLILIAASH